jgi:PAS domain S-box-containing protein
LTRGGIGEALSKILGRKNVWIFILAVTTAFAFLLNYFGLIRGLSGVTPHLFYIPIVIAAYWFPRRGVLFSVAVGMAYLGMVYYMTYPDVDSITSATARFYVLVAIGVIVASLSGNLKEQEDRYHGLFDYSEAGVFLIRTYPTHQVIEEVNQRGADLLGYRVRDLLGAPLTDIWIDPEEYGRFRNLVNTSGTVSDFESRMVKKDGSGIYVVMSAGTLPDNMVVFTIIDISERKSAEEALKESKERYQGLYNNALVGLARSRIHDGKVIEANEQMAHMFGYNDVEKYLGEFRFSQHYVDPGTREYLVEELMKHTTVSNFEARFTKSDGTYIWARFWARIFPEKGYIESVFTDITEEKLSHRALDESEERYRKLVDNLPDYVIVYANGRIQYANPAAADVVGKLPSEVVNMPILDFVAPESQDLVLQNSKRRQQGEEVEPYEIVISSPATSGRNVFINATPITFRDEPAVLAVLTDITEWKKAEDALNASKEQYKTTIDAMSDGIYLVDKNLNVVLLNTTFRRWLDRLGVSGEIVGKSVDEVLPCYKGEISAEFRMVFSSGEILITTDEFRVGGKDYVFETRKIPVFEDGVVTRVGTIMRNITMQKKIEAEKKIAYQQIEKNIEQFAILGDHIRNPMQVIVGLADLEGGELFKKINYQAVEIDRTINQLDKGWIESEKIREFIRKYYGIGQE